MNEELRPRGRFCMGSNLSSISVSKVRTSHCSQYSGVTTNSATATGVSLYDLRGIH